MLRGATVVFAAVIVSLVGCAQTALPTGPIDLSDERDQGDPGFETPDWLEGTIACAHGAYQDGTPFDRCWGYNKRQKRQLYMLYVYTLATFVEERCPENVLETGKVWAMADRLGLGYYGALDETEMQWISVALSTAATEYTGLLQAHPDLKAFCRASIRHPDLYNWFHE